MTLTVKTDRSSYVAAQQCPRKGWWISGFNAGVGIQPRQRKIYMPTGSATHLAVQALMQGVELATIQDTLSAYWLKEAKGVEVVDAIELREGQDLALALTLIWMKHRQQTFLAEYRVLAVEPEISVSLGKVGSTKVILRSRPDAIIQRISDGSVFMWELKTKAWVTDAWLNGWQFDLQLAAQTLAVEQWMRDNRLGDLPYGGAIIEALVKGTRKKDKAGIKRQQTPLVWAYVRGGDGFAVPPTLDYKWKKNFERQLVSSYMSLEEWVLHTLPNEETMDKAIIVPTITPSPEMVEDAVDQWRQAAVRQANQAEMVHKLVAMGKNEREYLNKWFPQHTSECENMDGCAFRGCCWDQAIKADPIASGKFEPRIDNHATVEVEE